MSGAQAQQQKKIKTAITPTREEDFALWYQAIVRAADMAENSPTRGAMIIKPYGYALWENIQRALDDMIKAEGVQNAYFPLLIPLSFISREAEHVDGFAKECAVVTHHRLEQGPDGKLVPAPSAQLEEPFVIRPTSETIIGDAMSRWVQSYRDLPLLLNQWCNVMRWEMRTRLFLRTSEFLWQEGHNAFETEGEAHEDAMKMLRVYNELFENWFAIPGIMGEKTADERFPGARRTFTIEAMMQDGKALQACTSHDLGQNFAKSCNIQFQGRDGQQHHAHTTSWGLSTRTIGGLIMTHGDDDGMIMPPKVAPQQVVIIPIVRDDSGADVVNERCKEITDGLRRAGFRVHFDNSDARTPDKMWGSIKRGVPIRVEVGQREAEEGTLTYIRRDLGKDSKKTVKVEEFFATLQSELDKMQADMLARARELVNSRIFDVGSLDEVRVFFEKGGVGFVRVDVSVLEDAAWETVKKDHALTPRCMPFADEGRKVLIGKSY